MFNAAFYRGLEVAVITSGAVVLTLVGFGVLGHVSPDRPHVSFEDPACG